MTIPGDDNSLEHENDLYEHHRFEVDRGQESIRIDKFLSNRLEKTSRNRIQNAMEAGCILVNGKQAKANYRIKPLDIISVVLPHPPREIELIPENIPLDIVYEDESFMIVNKPAGMVVHPAYGNYSGTLMNAVMFHLELEEKNGAFISAKGNGDVRPGLVHRIDKDTTGLLVIAKSEQSMASLAKQFFLKTVKRRYVALVWGSLKEDEGTIRGNIGRNLKDRKVMDVFPGGEHGKPAVTHYKVLERLGYVTLAECRLETGRTHQIRVHFKSTGHPLFNDREYGGDKILKGTTFTKYRQFVENCFGMLPGQALHARSLGFTHPLTGNEVFFESPLPPSFAALAEKWRKYGAGEKDA